MPNLLDPQGQPQALDALAESRPVCLDAIDECREFTAAEARAFFETLGRCINNQRIVDAAKVNGVRHGS